MEREGEGRRKNGEEREGEDVKRKESRKRVLSSNSYSY